MDEAMGILAELSAAVECDGGVEHATAEANAAKAAGRVQSDDAAAARSSGPRANTGDDDGSVIGRVWVADVLLLLGVPPALVAVRHYMAVAKSACPEFDADQNSWCKTTTKLRRECYAAALIATAGYVLVAHYGGIIDEQWQGGAALGLLLIGCAWGARSAVALTRMGGLPERTDGSDGGDYF